MVLEPLFTDVVVYDQAMLWVSADNFSKSVKINNYGVIKTIVTTFAVSSQLNNLQVVLKLFSNYTL